MEVNILLVIVGGIIAIGAIVGFPYTGGCVFCNAVCQQSNLFAYTD